jgi:hypothetical protein
VLKNQKRINIRSLPLIRLQVQIGMSGGQEVFEAERANKDLVIVFLRSNVKSSQRTA